MFIFSKNKIFKLLIRSLLVITGVVGIYLCISPDLKTTKKVSSLKITDRNGIILREVLSPAAGRGTPLRFDEISPEYLKVLISCEDTRFYKHHGIDFLAIMRALKENYRYERTISGASTLTQQLVRNLNGFKNRNLFIKGIEAIEAVRLDLHYSKQKIIEEYCNRISFGNNNFGIEAASQYYFQKSARNLTLSEAVFLVTIPKNPTLYNPFGKGSLTVGTRYKTTLKKLLNKGVIDTSDFQISMNNFPQLKFFSNHIKAPHFTNWVLSQVVPDTLEEIETTLDYSIQEDVESITRNWLNTCSAYHVNNAAVVVVKNSSGEILAYEGSNDFLDEEHQGQVDGVRSLRQPGSSIKPFTYAFALKKDFTTSTILADIPTHLPTLGGDFKPLNYDKTYHGPVRLRVALGCSYNIPAIRVAAALGVDDLLDFYHDCGFSSLTRSAREYGLGLTLGNGEITLLELAQGGKMFARYGMDEPLESIKSYRGINKTTYLHSSGARRIIPEQTAFLISDILSDHDARAPAFGPFSALDLPFRCSVKTGTTKDYKDNWTLGWTDSFTVAVWVGNFDNSPMENVSGVSGAAPIFHEIMMALEKKSQLNGTIRYVPPEIVKESVCELSGDKPGPYCKHLIQEYFVKNNTPSKICAYHTEKGVQYPPLFLQWAVDHNKKDSKAIDYNDIHLKITFPNNGDIFKIDPELDRAYQNILVKAQIPSFMHRVAIVIDNNKDESQIQLPFSYRWKLIEGVHRIRLFDPQDPRRSDEISITVVP